MSEKVSVSLDYSTATSEEFVTVNDDIVYSASTMSDKDILEVVLSSKNIIEADSADENEMKMQPLFSRHSK
ncbi:hypothetical protein TNCV_175851 [Trichonephila clavipes]|nr:hypothetical protein TNCV_175851 [Trichonephila clavipes]